MTFLTQRAFTFLSCNPLVHCSQNRFWFTHKKYLRRHHWVFFVIFALWLSCCSCKDQNIFPIGVKINSIGLIGLYSLICRICLSTYQLTKCLRNQEIHLFVIPISIRVQLVIHNRVMDGWAVILQT